MGKATRIRQQNAREKIAAQRAAERRAEMRKRMFITGGSVIGVIAIVVAFIVIKLVSSPSTTKPSAASGTALPASVTKNLTSVPASTLNAVGAGSVPQTVQTPVKTISGTPLISNGKPEMLYIGAEFCPYCAAMRWSMAVALSRFGALSTPLRGIHSAGGSEAYPNTATLTFYKSTYSSKYLAFTPVENEKVDHSPLQATTTQQQALWQKYDANSYPFIDIGNKYLVTVIYNPQVLKGKTWSQIAAATHDPSSPIAQGVDGAANYLTAAVCKITNNQPASVCTSPAIKTLAGRL
jgi:thiol-disulfide isomerase/thioredoxin